MGPDSFSLAPVELGKAAQCDCFSSSVERMRSTFWGTGSPPFLNRGIAEGVDPDDGVGAVVFAVLVGSSTLPSLGICARVAG